jgi:integrase
MILMAYRHGFRAAELVDLCWDQIDFRGVILHALRVKNGMPSTHPIQGDELRALRRLQRESEVSPFVVSERGSLFTTAGFARTAAALASVSRYIRACFDTAAVSAREQRTRYASNPRMAWPSVDHVDSNLYSARTG